MGAKVRFIFRFFLGNSKLNVEDIFKALETAQQLTLEPTM